MQSVFRTREFCSETNGQQCPQRPLQHVPLHLARAHMFHMASLGKPHLAALSSRHAASTGIGPPRRPLTTCLRPPQGGD